MAYSLFFFFFLLQCICNDLDSSMHEMILAFSQCYLKGTLDFFQVLTPLQSKINLRILESLASLCSKLMALSSMQRGILLVE